MVYGLKASSCDPLMTMILDINMLHYKIDVGENPRCSKLLDEIRVYIMELHC